MFRYFSHLWHSNEILSIYWDKIWNGLLETASFVQTEFSSCYFVCVCVRGVCVRQQQALRAMLSAPLAVTSQAYGVSSASWRGPGRPSDLKILQHSTQVFSGNTHTHTYTYTVTHTQRREREKQRFRCMIYVCFSTQLGRTWKRNVWKNGGKESRANNLSAGINISLTVAWTLLVLRAAPTMDDYDMCACMSVYSRYTNSCNL